MARKDTRVLTAHVPVALADKVDEIAEHLDRSRAWIVKQALADWIALEEERDRLTREALTEVEDGHTVDHADVVAWSDSLDGDRPLPTPR